MGDWADLIPDLLLLIAQRINLLEDFIAFGAVCKSWRSVVAAKENFNGPQQVPWLMVDARDDDDDDDERYFLSLTKYRLRDRRVTLPEAKGKQCLESLGWLVTVSEEGEMNLLHPLSRRQIGLPHLSTLKNFKYDSRLHKWLFIRKAVLSSNPSKEENYTLVVIYGFRFGFLGFWRPGDEAWTTIETQEGSCVDVTYHKGKFYGIDIDQGAIFVCDVGGSNPTLAQVVEEIPFEIIASQRSYIVESAGRLLIIAQHKFQLENLRFDSNIDGESLKFRVFEVDLGNARLTEKNSLGENALFLDDCGSISVEASKLSGIKANFIYYLDVYWVIYSYSKRQRGTNMWYIYNMEDQSHTCYWRGDWFDKFGLPPWITPSL